MKAVKNNTNKPSENMISVNSTKPVTEMNPANNMFDISISDKWHVMRFRNIEVKRLIQHVEENNLEIHMSVVIEDVHTVAKLSLYDLKQIQSKYGSNFVFEFVTVEESRICIYSNR